MTTRRKLVASESRVGSKPSSPCMAAALCGREPRGNARRQSWRPRTGRCRVSTHGNQADTHTHPGNAITHPFILEKHALRCHLWIRLGAYGAALAGRAGNMQALWRGATPLTHRLNREARLCKGGGAARAPAGGAKDSPDTPDTPDTCATPPTAPHLLSMRWFYYDYTFYGMRRRRERERETAQLAQQQACQ